MFPVSSLEFVKRFLIGVAGAVQFFPDLVELLVKRVETIQKRGGRVEDFLLVAFLIGARPGDLN